MRLFHFNNKLLDDLTLSVPLPEVTQEFFSVESNNFSDVDSKVEADGASKPSRAVHDVVFTRGERQKVEVDQRWYLRQKITCEAKLLVENGVKDCKQTIDGEGFWTDLDVQLLSHLKVELITFN